MDLSEVTEKTKELLNQVTSGCKFGAGFCLSLIWKAPAIAARVVMFKGTFSSLKEGLVTPLAAHIRNIKDPNLSKKEHEKAYQNFLIFWPEMILKINRAIPTLATEVSYNAISGVVSSRPILQNPAVKSEAALMLVKSMWKEIKNGDPDVKFTSRLLNALLKAGADVSSEILEELGIPELQAALQGPSIDLN